MENITIVLLRSELNYLINYDSARISSDRIINLSYNEFKLLREEHQISLLQNSLPIFEQDHELVLVEYNSTLMSYDNAPVIEFNGISSIIPLTKMGARLLSSKLNTDFNILDCLDSKLYNSFIENRNHLLRIRASQKLCSIYNLSLPDEKFITHFKKATLFQINNTVPSSNDSTLAHLIAFNVTPSFIPEGNIEALIKSACVGMKKLDLDVEQIKKSTFYKFVMEEKENINRKSLFLAIKYVEEKTDLDEDEKTRFNKLKRTLSDNAKFESAFLLFSYFYSLKKEIEKNNYDISAPKYDILELKHYDPDSASKVLFMLGYTFSIQTISKSLQSFSNSQLLKTKKVLDLKWAPPVKEDTQTVAEVNEEVERNISNLEKTHQEKTYEVEDETTHVIELSLEDKTKEENSSYEVSKSKEDPNIENEIDLFSDQKKSSNDNDKSEFPQTKFNYKEFEKNIGGGDFSRKILSALQNQDLLESQITKAVIISCLEEIEEHKTKKGEVKVNAKKALKIFE